MYADVNPILQENIGIGVDIESIDRFRDQEVLGDENFLNKIFTKNELNYCFSKREPAASIAARFAGKEAVLKALNHFGRCPLVLSEIEITHDENQVPKVTLHNKDVEQFQVQISLSHSRDDALAFAMVVKRGRS